MGFEIPIISAALTRLPNPEISLAAHGSVVAPLSWIIEAPIIMLLAASTALSKDWPSYVKMRRFMNVTSAILTLFHILVAFTPLYYIVVRDMIGVPPEVLEPARIDLMVMLPWTWAIAYRRFNQGVLIRFGHSGTIGMGTVLRLLTTTTVSLAGFSIGSRIQPTLIGGIAMSLGVLVEALYTGIRVRPVIENELKPAPVIENALTYREFFVFYIPLALTSALQLLFSPLGSASMSRMPEALLSLAVWPVVSSALFIMRSGGIAFNEVVVATLDYPGSLREIRRFAVFLIISFTLITVVMALTPLAPAWFGGAMGLQAELAEIARLGLLLGSPIIAVNVLISYYQGMLVSARRTRGVPESVGLSLLATTVIFILGVIIQSIKGVYISVLAMMGGFIVQALWLYYRSRKVVPIYQARDSDFKAS